MENTSYITEKPVDIEQCVKKHRDGSWSKIIQKAQCLKSTECVVVDITGASIKREKTIVYGLRVAAKKVGIKKEKLKIASKNQHLYIWIN